MKYYFAVEVIARFGVLAESQEEAYKLAEELCPVDDAPARARISHEAYCTPNQREDLKKEAVNYDD